MPYFNIPERRVVAQPLTVSAEAAGSGFGENIVGAAQDSAQIQKQMLAAREKAAREQEKTDRLELGVKLDEQLITHSELAEDITQQNPNGKGIAEAYTKESKKLTDDFISSVPGHLQNEARAKMSRLVTEKTLSLRSTENQLKAESTAADMVANIDVMQNMISTGRLSPEDALSRVQNNYENLQLLNPKAANAYKESATDSVLSAKFLHSLDTNGYQKTLADYKANVYDELDFNVAQSLLKRAEAKVKVDVNGVISEAKRSLSLGAIPSADIKATIALAKDVGLDSSVNELEMLQRNQGQLLQFGKVSFNEKQRILSNAKERMLNQADDESILLTSALSSSLRQAKSSFEENPYWYYENIGVIPPTEMLDFSEMDPESFAEVFEERKLANNLVLSHEGVDTLPLLKNEEIQVISSIMKSSPANQKAELMNALGGAAGWDGLAKIANQIAPKDREPARVLAIAASRPQLAKEILFSEGREVDMPEKAKLIQYMHDENYIAAGLPASVQSDVLESVKMVLRARADGSMDSKETENLVTGALKDLLGEPVKLPSDTYMLPPIDKSGVVASGSDLRRAFKKLDSAMWESVFDDYPVDSLGYQLTAEDIRDRVQFIPHGPDGYLMVPKSVGPNAVPMLKSDSTPFRITHEDMFKLMDATPPTLFERVFE